VTFRSRAGTLRAVGSLEHLDAWLPELERSALAGRRESRRCTLGEWHAFYKGSALRGKHALRHALRRALGWSDIPRLQEFENLTWLREHGFLAPRPLLAGVFTRSGVPRFQFLCTEFVADAPTLDAWLARTSRWGALAAVAQSERASVVSALARDLAQLHSLGFVHRDLFARNLLVSSAGGARRIVFLDAWRGGPRRGSRGPEHDVACFFLDGASLLEREEQALFLSTYGAERARCGRALPRGWLGRVERCRKGVFRRESRRRGASVPAEWAPPALPDS